ncbi:MAG: hypothetical protein JNL83_14430 [Myxococcales bacterium]|nr:hypothetical protein [Myxococcales bacterium]
MIASRRGLLVLLVVAVLLGGWLVWALTRAQPEPVDRAIAPGVDVDRVSDLVWERAPLPPLRVTPASEGRWRWELAEDRAVADGSVVRDVLAALRAARWHRRADVSAAGAMTTWLTVTAGPTTRMIGIGQPLEGTEQQWLVVGESALLVDRWVVRALDPGALSLRVRRPVEEMAAAKRIAIEHGAVHLRMEAPPARLVAPFTLLLRQDVVAGLTRALESIELVRISRPAREQDVVLSIQAGGQLKFAPACPADASLAWVASDVGNGCITRGAYDEVVRAVSALEQPASGLAEPRLVPFDVRRVELVDGARLDLTRRAEIDGKTADTEAVTQLLAALGAPANVVEDTGGSVRARLRVTGDAGGVVTIELLGDGRVHREGEPVALELAPAAYAAVTRRGTDLADRAVWAEEASTITELVIDRVTYRRGAVLGEWTRVPAGKVDGARVEALVAALAEVRRSPDVASARVQHEVAIVVTPPAGAPVRHELAVGAPRQGGCPAYAGNVTVQLPTPICAGIAALAR